MKNVILILAVTICLSACTDKGKNANCMVFTRETMDSLRSELLKADIDFSEMSELKGSNAAFTEYASEHATLLRPYSMPVTGKDSIMHMLRAHPDSLYKITWAPISADVAMSGEIGYTYGTYALDEKGGRKTEGTYCTVWHKGKSKKWKFILDTSNEGLNAVDKTEEKAAEKAEETK